MERRMNVHPDIILKPFIDESGIKKRVEELAHEIEADFRGEEIVLIGALKGSFMFAADLVRALHRRRIPMVIDFVQVSSYGSDTVSSGRLSMTRDVTAEVGGKCVLLVDDISDTGRTSRFLSDHILARKPRLFKTAVFLDKPARRIVRFDPDYAGFRVPDAFIVGYGLDYDNRYRERPGLSLVSFGDREDEPFLSFWIENDVIFLKGNLDFAGTAWIRETLVHWNGNLGLNLQELVDIGPEGLDLLRTVSNAAEQTDHHVRLIETPRKLRESLIFGGLEKRIAD
jgi:hypoxanthine phosphoribosyltransferase